MRVIALGTLLLSAAGAALEAQPRYRFGDDPAWAAVAFDDSLWLAAPEGPQPLPSYASGGFVWIRFRVPVPPDASPLAVRIGGDGVNIPGEVWVNGVRVGSHGRFPRDPDVRYATRVFDLPAGVAAPGSRAVVAWRAWLSPANTLGLIANSPRPVAEIGSGDFMRARESAELAGAALTRGAETFLAVCEIVLGLALLVLCLVSQGPAMLRWFSIFLLGWGAAILVQLTGHLQPGVWTETAYWTAWYVLSTVLNVAINLCQGAALGLPPWTVRSLVAMGVIWPIPWMLQALTVTPASWVAEMEGLAHPALLFTVWLTGQALAAVWALACGPREARSLAAAFVAWSCHLAFSQGILTFLPMTILAGGQRLSTENLASMLVIGVMCWLLLRRLWLDWQAREELRAEFDAARAMQLRLVPSAAGVPGFEIESAYHPARQVGGDFFRIAPGTDGSVLLVAGDVSGKGLAAAMTVAAIAGALDNEQARSPGQVLGRLNQALLRRKEAGFVTCCAVLFTKLGRLRVANAGHPAPYSDGVELAVEAGLPLGISADGVYPEVEFDIEANGTVTFVTDGVVEAASATGELFGFERTREISTRPAREIAEAARAWGQNDDITVVTVRRVG